MAGSKQIIEADVVLIGAGIMSSTLASMLKELHPDISIHILERLDAPAAESSDAWNNAGTGHSALCELNYTPEKEDGSIDVEISLAIKPTIDLGDYKSLIPAVENKEIDVKDIDARLEEIAKSSAPLEKLSRKRAVKDGDHAVID